MTNRPILAGNPYPDFLSPCKWTKVNEDEMGDGLWKVDCRRGYLVAGFFGDVMVGANFCPFCGKRLKGLTGETDD